MTAAAVAGWALVALACVTIGVAKSGFGAGLGLIAVPMTVVGLGYTALGGEAAMGLLLPLLIAGDFFAVWQWRREVRGALPALRPLVVPACVGIGFGALLLHALRSQAGLAEALIRLEIGVESMLLVGLTWWRQRTGAEGKLMREPLRGWLTGTFAGASSTLAHAAGPVVALYLLPLKMDRARFVTACVVFFAGANVLKLAAYFPADAFRGVPALLPLALLPLVIVGAIVGYALNRRLSERGFARVVLTATLALGVYLTFDGAAKLARTW